MQELSRYPARSQRRSAIDLLPCAGLAPVVRRVDNAIHRINRYPADKFQQNILRYPQDSDLSGR